MSYLPRLLFNICKATVAPEQGDGTMSIMIQRPYAYLKNLLLTVFERQEDVNVNVIVDTRYRDGGQAKNLLRQSAAVSIGKHQRSSWSKSYFLLRPNGVVR